MDINNIDKAKALIDNYFRLKGRTLRGRRINFRNKASNYY